MSTSHHPLRVAVVGDKFSNRKEEGTIHYKTIQFIDVLFK